VLAASVPWWRGTALEAWEQPMEGSEGRTVVDRCHHLCSDLLKRLWVQPSTGRPQLTQGQVSVCRSAQPSQPGSHRARVRTHPSGDSPQPILVRGQRLYPGGSLGSCPGLHSLDKPSRGDQEQVQEGAPRSRDQPQHPRVTSSPVCPRWEETVGLCLSVASAQVTPWVPEVPIWDPAAYCRPSVA
jgi:hypothetical protein